MLALDYSKEKDTSDNGLQNTEEYSITITQQYLPIKSGDAHQQQSLSGALCVLLEHQGLSSPCSGIVRLVLEENLVT